MLISYLIKSVFRCCDIQTIICSVLNKLFVNDKFHKKHVNGFRVNNQVSFWKYKSAKAYIIEL